MWPFWCVGWYDTVIISCLVSNVPFYCIVQHSLYHDMDIGTLWLSSLVSCTPSQSTGLFFVWALFWCSLSLGAPFTYSIDRIPFHHDFHHGCCYYYCTFMAILYLLNLMFRFPVTKFWFCSCATPWMFPPLGIVWKFDIKKINLLITSHFNASQYEYT